jgi:hypothetical protein
MDAVRRRLSAWAATAGALARTPYGVILLGYVVLRLGGFAGVETLAYRDTRGYLEVASHPVWSLDFLGGGRPWTLPLLYKLLPDSDQARAWGQFLASVACWPVLAAALARCLRQGPFRYVAFAAVLLFSMSIAVIQWDTILLSESLSISLTALVLAAWLELVREPRPALVIGVLGATLLWVFARDSNGVVALLTVPLAAVLLWRPGQLGRAWAAGLAGGLLAIFLASFAATTTDAAQLRRNERPILHVIGRRVLADRDQTRYFRAHGMPQPPPRVLAQRRRLAGIAEGGLPSDPQTDRFLEWAREHGRWVLARYLLTHPVKTVRQTVARRRRLISGVTAGYRSPNARRVLPEPLAPLLYPRDVQSVLFWLVVVGLAAAALWRAVGARRTWLIPVAALALQFPHALVVYHGDTLEVPRHGILVAVTSRLAVLLLALLVIDRALEVRRTRRRAQTEEHSPKTPEPAVA